MERISSTRKLYYGFIIVFLIMIIPTCGPKLSSETRFLNHYQTADEFMLKNDYKKAIKYYRKAMKIQHKNPKVYRQMALCFEKLNQLDSSITYYEGAIVFNPKDSDAYQRIADIYYDQSMPHEAMTWYDRAIDLGYIYPESYTKLGNIHYRWKEYINAKNYYEYATIADSSNAAGYYGLGLTHLALGDTLAAETDFQNAVNYGSHANASFMLGLICFKKHEYDKALKWFNTYLRFEPEGEYVLKAKEYVMTIKIKMKAMDK